MGPFVIPQGLLGRGAVIPVRLHRVAKLRQRGLGGQNEMRSIDAGLSPQESVIGSEGAEGEPSAASAGRAGGRAAGIGAGEASCSGLAGLATRGADGGRLGVGDENGVSSDPKSGAGRRSC